MARDNSIQWNPEDVKKFDFSLVKALIVGGTGGLGRAIATNLHEKGADVTIVGQSLRDTEDNKLHFIKADLSLVKNCEKVASDLNKNGLTNQFTHIIFTTGIFSSKNRQVTADGIERDMAISYLSRYIMLRSMEPHISKTFKVNGTDAKPRVFVMGYPGSNQAGNPDDMNADPVKYGFLAAHMNTVAANEAIVLHYAKKTKPFNIYGLNPGMVKTNIRTNLTGTGFLARTMENIMGFFVQSPEDYASNIVPLLVTPEIENHDGAMFDNKANGLLKSTNIDGNVEKFWENSAKLTELGH